MSHSYVLFQPELAEIRVIRTQRHLDVYRFESRKFPGIRKGDKLNWGLISIDIYLISLSGLYPGFLSEAAMERPPTKVGRELSQVFDNRCKTKALN